MSSLIEKAAGEVATRPHKFEERNIGRLLLDAGLITADGAEKALRLHKQEGIRFGEACVKLGLVGEADIQQALSSQFDYPYLRPGQGKISAELVAAYQPFSRQVESLRAVRTQLLLRWFNQERKILPLVSTNRGDGRTFIAANLAIVFSQLGENTLLIDANLRAPKQHKLFMVENHTGLSSLLVGRESHSIVQRVEAFANLSIVCSGPQPPNPLELLSRSELPDFLQAMASQFDVVLVDTPAHGVGSDALAVAGRAGGALIVVREGRTRVRWAQALTRSLHDANAEVVGCVLNKH